MALGRSRGWSISLARKISHQQMDIVRTHQQVTGIKTAQQAFSSPFGTLLITRYAEEKSVFNGVELASAARMAGSQEASHCFPLCILVLSGVAQVSIYWLHPKLSQSMSIALLNRQSASMPLAHRKLSLHGPSSIPVLAR